MPEHNFLKCECGSELWLIYRAELTMSNDTVRTVDVYRCVNCLTEHAGEDISITPRVRKSARSHWIARRIQNIPYPGRRDHAEKPT